MQLHIFLWNRVIWQNLPLSFQYLSYWWKLIIPFSYHHSKQKLLCMSMLFILQITIQANTKCYAQISQCLQILGKWNQAHLMAFCVQNKIVSLLSQYLLCLFLSCPTEWLNSFDGTLYFILPYLRWLSFTSNTSIWQAKFCSATFVTKSEIQMIWTVFIYH